MKTVTLALLVASALAGCEPCPDPTPPKAFGAAHITVNGAPVTVVDGTRLSYRDEKTGKFTELKIEQP